MNRFELTDRFAEAQRVTRGHRLELIWNAMVEHFTGVSEWDRAKSWLGVKERA